MTVKAYGLDSLHIFNGENSKCSQFLICANESNEWVIAVRDGITWDCVELSTQELESLGHWALAAARAPLDDGLEEIRRYGT